ncbi:hypothetical protein WJS89_05600 [Sphingomicrobium sp. XHP0235]|uniref:hypothetical protein n=1 Tax=Sphingomicrobium aquimarinum TaxID=3133971 RepID=UPI0031FECA6D
MAKNFHRVSLVALGVATFATSALAGPNDMDIAGVKLGMEWAEAEQKLIAANYACRSSGTIKTFQERVQSEIKRRNGEFEAWPQQSGTRFWWCEGKSGEELQIGLAHPELGPVIDTLKLYVTSDRFDLARFEEQVSAKYGLPTGGTVKNGVWCTNGATRCGGIGEDNPYFRTISQQGFDTTVSFSILAERGSTVSKTETEAVMREADQLSPKNNSAAF